MTMSAFSWATRVVATAVVALDGTGDFTDIQTALVSLPAGGGVVYLKDGAFTLTTGLLINSANVALIGAGRSTKITSASDIKLLNIAGADYFHIENIYFEGNNTLGSNPNISIDNSDNGRIISCWSEKAPTNGLTTASLSNTNIISNCVFSNNKINGINLSAGADNTIIVGNICNSNLGRGILTGQITNAIISDNTCSLNTKDGIRMSDSNDNLISDNICVDNDIGNTATWSGISLSNSDSNIISGNRNKDNDNYEIDITNATCNDNLVHGNHCKGADHVGAINDSGTNTTLADNVIA